MTQRQRACCALCSPAPARPRPRSLTMLLGSGSGHADALAQDTPPWPAAELPAFNPLQLAGTSDGARLAVLWGRRTFDLDCLARLDLGCIRVDAVALGSRGLHLVNRRPVSRAIGQPEPQQLSRILSRTCVRHRVSCSWGTSCFGTQRHAHIGKTGASGRCRAAGAGRTRGPADPCRAQPAAPAQRPGPGLSQFLRAG